MKVDYSARSGSIIAIFSIFKLKACCVLSLESPHRGDSNEYTQHINIKRKSHKIISNIIMSAAMGFFPRD